MSSDSDFDLADVLRERRRQFWLFTVLIIVTCGAIAIASYFSHGKWWQSLFGFMLPMVLIMPLRVVDYISFIRRAHYLDYRVRKTERITDECVTSSRELRAQIDSGVHVWSSNGPPQA